MRNDPIPKRITHSTHVRFLTLTGHIEARNVRVTANGFASPEIPATLQDSLSHAGLLPWDDVLAVDVQDNQAARGAIGGGMAFGIVGLLIGFAGGIASPEGEVGSWSLKGAAAGFAGGAALGGLIGAPQQRWVRVYPAAHGSSAMPRRVAAAADSAVAMPVRVIAIAPFADVSKRKNADQAAQRIREGIVRELTLHSDANTVSIQTVEETDRRLREAAYSRATASHLPAAEICRLLGSDAVMMGAITRYHQKSGAGTFMSVVFLQPATRGREVEADLAIYAAPSGRVVWRQHIRKATGLFTSTATLGNAVGAAVAEKFPYTRELAHE